MIQKDFALFLAVVDEAEESCYEGEGRAGAVDPPACVSVYVVICSVIHGPYGHL